MKNLKVVKINNKQLERKSREKIVFYSACVSYFVLDGFYFFAGNPLHQATYMQVETVLSFAIGALSTRLGASYFKITGAFCAYSMYIVVVDSIFPEPTSLQWFLEVLLFGNIVFYIYMKEKI